MPGQILDVHSPVRVFLELQFSFVIFAELISNLFIMLAAFVTELVALLSPIYQKVHSPNLLKRKCISGAARICIIIIFHLSKL